MRERILLIMPKFHEYPKIIRKALVEQGNDVDVFYDFSTNLLHNKLKTSNSKVLTIYTNFYKKKILRKIKSKNYDKVLVIKGCGLDSNFFKVLNEIQSNAIFYLYQWDSLANYWYESILQYFDHCYSFDSDDVNQINQEKLKYLPLFFDDGVLFQHQDESYKYDIAFIGGVTLERYYWLTDFKDKCEKAGLKVYLFMYLPFFTYMNLIVRGKFINFNKINFKPISLKRIKDIYAKTNTILDVHNPKQSGLTMRTFEALGSGKKLMTTNFNIKKEPFFNTDYILTFKLLDDVKPEVIDAFIRNSGNGISLDQYKLSSWLHNIFNVSIES